MPEEPACTHVFSKGEWDARDSPKKKPKVSGVLETTEDNNGLAEGGDSGNSTVAPFVNVEGSLLAVSMVYTDRAERRWGTDFASEDGAHYLCGEITSGSDDKVGAVVTPEGSVSTKENPTFYGKAIVTPIA